MKIKKKIFLIIISLFLVGKVNAEISDSLFMTVGNEAVLKSDVVTEIKTILILNNKSYNNEKKDELQKVAINSIIKRKVKQIEIDRNNFFSFNKKDLEKEIIRLANNLSVDVDTLKNICASNELDFSSIENNIKTELMWNSLIFQLFKGKLKINADEINEQLQMVQNQKKTNEYLISEILIEPVENNKIDSKIEEIKSRIESDGFENVAKSLGISESSLNGGDLGWLNEGSISEKIKTAIINTPVGKLSEAVLLTEGILIFKIRDKRVVDKNTSLEEKKNKLVNDEKIKILTMYSLSHYDKVRRSVSIKFIE